MLNAECWMSGQFRIRHSAFSILCMKIAIHGRPFGAGSQPALQGLFEELARRQWDVRVSAPYQEALQQGGVWHAFAGTYAPGDDLGDRDFIFSLGGDGTLLESLTHVGDRQTPLVGVNVGRLGFLATIAPDKLTETLELLSQGQFEIEERSLLHVDSDPVEGRPSPFAEVPFGLNDFCVTKTDRSSMIVVHTWLDGAFLNSYWADGLVVSTPTGSTGYSLSVGGPVVLPRTQNFIIAPISPHNLNVRPMVVNDRSVISMSVESRSGNFLVSLDARSQVVDQSLKFTVRKETFPARLIKLPGHTFLDTLRHKLNWGLDSRN
jgi:NAD+ kinase